MLIDFEERHAELDEPLVEPSPKHSPHDPLERDPVRAGHGACKSCNCPGYIPDKPNYCTCGHHFSQHK